MPPIDESVMRRKRLQGLFNLGQGAGARASSGGAGGPARGSDGGHCGPPHPEGQHYWRSLNELADTPEFEEMLQREFSALATEVIEPSSRRDFLRLMGASLALAGIGLTSCRWPEEKIAPFAKKQDGYTMGVPVQFATAMDMAGFATGLLVTSYDGRPIKVEGNPLHPSSLGAATMWHQASVLDIYDANRSKTALRRNTVQDAGEFAAPAEVMAVLQQVFAGIRQSRGSRTAILCEAHSSPTRLRLQREIARKMPLLQWYEYEPLGWDSVREGTRMAFGQPLRPQYKLEAADVIVSFGCDFLVHHPDSLHLAREWAKRRRPENGPLNRVYMFEAAHTLTGANADHRIQVKPSRLEAALYALAGALNSGLSLGLDPRLFSGAKADFLNAGGSKAYEALLADMAHRGRAVVMAGPQLSPQAHAVAAALNHALGAETVSYIAEEQPLRQSHLEALAGFAERLRGHNFDNLLIIGGNPVYDAPPSLGLAGELGNVRNTVHLTLHDNETSQHCKWSLPRAHYLEEWNDARGYDGSYSVVQPLIEPLYGGLTPHELLTLLLEGSQRKPYDLVRETFAGLAGGGADFESRWAQTLHSGVLADSAPAPTVPQLLIASALQPLPPAAEAELELLLVPDYSVYDGRFANNGWLQETPDPMTKLTWDNALLLGVAEAQKRGLGHENVVEVTGPAGASIKLPVYVLPGIPEGVAVAQLGYGRSAAGDVGSAVGSNTFALRTVESPAWSSVTLANAPDIHYFAETQDHFAIDMRGFEERGKRVSALVREANVAVWEEHPDFAGRMQHAPAEVSRWQDWTYPDQTNPQTGQRAVHRWGMAIDLAACMGCSACVTACTAENNIPVVGKLRVRQGREMLWLRIDRYFRTPVRAGGAESEARPDDAKVALMPLTCHHCEMAPCEQVCPVNATTHSDEGLNDMVYNRCIGTRYCSNNCPFKVRRFNFFNYQKSLTETQKLVHNPQVTIRSRGVMEKCTYCVQRIQNGKINARVAGRELADGEIRTACQQTCPTDAIVFGDLNNPDSRVRELRFGVHSDRSYTLLDELQVRPRTNYLAGMWNPAPGTDEIEAPAPVLFGHDSHGDHSAQDELSPGPSPEQLSEAEVEHAPEGGAMEHQEHAPVEH